MRRIVWALAVLVVVLLVAAVWTAIAQPAVGRTIWSFVHDYRWWGGSGRGHRGRRAPALAAS